MMRITYDKPKNRLPRAEGMSDSRFRFGDRTPEQLLEGTYLNRLFKRAVREPSKTHYYYFEENGYEYEYRATYFPKRNEIVTNDCRCPSYVNHHLGSTCGVCGQVG